MNGLLPGGMEEHLVDEVAGQDDLPDVGAFRAHVQDAYLASEFTADWPEGLLDRINAVE